MADTILCHWLMDNADAPIRYRTARELLHDLKTAKKLESALLQNKAVGLWLQNLKPHTPPQHQWMEHGSFDFCLENAMLKAVQLGLHGGLPQVTDAVGYYLAKMQKYAVLEQKRRDFAAIITANLLSLAEVDNESTQRYMLGNLNELYCFAQRKDYTLYLSEEERKRLTGVPACWKSSEHFIRPEILREYGLAYPLLYDIVGLHSLYRLHDPEIDRKIDTVIRYLSTDEFHRKVRDGYGILAEGGGVYHSMGWDPKYPGWFGVAAYLENGYVPQLLFFALYASRYPAVRETKWFQDLLLCLEAYQTDGGRIAFPAEWLVKKQGYAVMGRHLSFGENRRKKNWREIESTFYIQMLRQQQRLP